MGSALVAVVFVAAAFAGYIYRPLGIPQRILLLLAALALIPSPAAGTVPLFLNVAGLIIGGGVILIQRRGKSALPETAGR